MKEILALSLGSADLRYNFVPMAVLLSNQPPKVSGVRCSFADCLPLKLACGVSGDVIGRWPKVLAAVMYVPFNPLEQLLAKLTI